MKNLEGEVSGDTTLTQQENTLNATERNGSLQLTDYQRTSSAGISKHENTAVFRVREQTDNTMPMLKMVEIPDNQTESEIKNQFPDRKKLFVTDVWVTNVIKKVLVLR